MNIRNIRVVLRAGLGLTAIATVAGVYAEGGQSQHRESTKVFQEVMNACHAANPSQVMIFLPIARRGRAAPSPEDEASYIANPTHFAHAQQVSPCWTRDRWERYVHAVAAEDRVTYGAK
jgi:hypothetical protein